jgi:hypothetical protein
VVTISFLLTNIPSLALYCNNAPSFNEVTSTSPNNFKERELFSAACPEGKVTETSCGPLDVGALIFAVLDVGALIFAVIVIDLSLFLKLLGDVDVTSLNDGALLQYRASDGMFVSKNEIVTTTGTLTFNGGSF